MVQNGALLSALPLASPIIKLFKAIMGFLFGSYFPTLISPFDIGGLKVMVGASYLYP